MGHKPEAQAKAVLLEYKPEAQAKGSFACASGLCRDRTVAVTDRRRPAA
jgi:hypothetical protein